MITYPPELLPEAEDPETAEVIVDGKKLDWRAIEFQLVHELKLFNKACSHLINAINAETDDSTE